MPDEYSGLANTALEMVAQQGMIVPALFWYELRNVLIVSERRGRIDASRSNEALRRISLLQGETDIEPANDGLMRIARDHSLTAYDAAYVELALRTHSPLATLDQKLARSAATAGVTIVANAAR